jgi:hypothetical protein
MRFASQKNLPPHCNADVRDFLELKFFMSLFGQYMAISESFLPFLNVS